MKNSPTREKLRNYSSCLNRCQKKNESDASPAGGQGGIAPPIFVFAPPIYFLPPHRDLSAGFWEEKVAVFGWKNCLNF